MSQQKTPPGGEVFDVTVMKEKKVLYKVIMATGFRGRKFFMVNRIVKTGRAKNIKLMAGRVSSGFYKGLSE